MGVAAAGVDSGRNCGTPRSPRRSVHADPRPRAGSQSARRCRARFPEPIGIARSPRRTVRTASRPRTRWLWVSAVSAPVSRARWSCAIASSVPSAPHQDRAQVVAGLGVSGVDPQRLPVCAIASSSRPPCQGETQIVVGPGPSRAPSPATVGNIFNRLVEPSGPPDDPRRGCCRPANNRDFARSLPGRAVRRRRRTSNPVARSIRGAGEAARLANERGLPFIHLSTDYVFDGRLDRPYREDDPVNPLGAYGRSKLLGERTGGRAAARSTIVRTSWVYSPFGSNFVKTMLRLGASNGTVRVVDDRLARPTSALDMADALLNVARQRAGSARRRRPARRLPHDGAGEGSWADFAEEIFEERGAPRSIARGESGGSRRRNIRPPRRSPRNSRLNNDKFCTGVRLCIAGLAPIDARLRSSRLLARSRACTRKGLIMRGIILAGGSGAPAASDDSWPSQSNCCRSMTSLWSIIPCRR